MRSPQHHWRGLVEAIWRRGRRQRRGAIAVIFAILIVPIIGLIGLAVDFGIWNQAHAMLTRAANSAALNAVKVAGNAQLKADANFEQEGQTAGQQWFNSQVAAATLPITTNSLQVTISAGQSLSATVAYSGTIPSVFGAIFSAAQYPLEVTAVASISTNPYLNVELMLDNSSSMEIAATQNGMRTLLQNSPCDPSMVWYAVGNNDYTPPPPRQYPPSAQPYGDYQCSASTGSSVATTVGGVACPVTNIFSGGTYLPSSNINTKANPQLCPSSSLLQPNAYQGAPCAFACHFDGTKQAGLGNDTYSLARRLGVQLRFDVLKTATQNIISTMQSSNVASINNLRVGVFTFNTDVTKVYPPSGEADNDWAAASSAVGYSPPDTGSLQETGIQPPVATWSANNNTMFSLSMTHLVTENYLTAAGDGSSASSPRKVLMIVTDGMEDSFNSDGSDNRGPINTAVCQTIKNMGYTIYVVYTSYIPIMHDYYFKYLQGYVENTAPTSVSGNLQACASSPDDYIEASDITELKADLQNFLTAALNAPARFTQ